MHRLPARSSEKHLHKPEEKQTIRSITKVKSRKHFPFASGTLSITSRYRKVKTGAHCRIRSYLSICNSDMCRVHRIPL